MRARRKPQGQVLLLSVVLLSVVLGLVGAFIGYLGGVRKATNTFSARAAARQAALSGIEKALWCLNQSSGTDCGGTYGGDYDGETDVSVGGSAYYTTTIASAGSNLKTVTSIGSYPSTANPTATVTLKADVKTDTVDASFNYGVQAGNGGFEMENNAFVVGSIYANGDVVGAENTYASGTVIVAGGTDLVPNEEQTTNNADYEFGRTSPVLDIAQSFEVETDEFLNKVSFYLKKTGSPSDRTVYILADDGGVPSTTVIGSATLNASNVTTSFAWTDVSFPTPPALVGGQRYWLAFDATASSSKYWTIGSLPNNGYGNGVGMYSADWDADTPVWTDAGRDYAFKVWTGGVDTKIDSMEAYADAKAHRIEDSVVDGDAYYQEISNTTVGGTSYPGSADPGPIDLPISDAQIDQWKTEAAAGGTISGDVLYSNNCSESLGPKKITGDLTVDNNCTLTVTGTLYVQGDLNFNNNVIIRLDPGYEETSGMIITDGRIDIYNNVTFQNSGTAGSYVLVLSTHPSVDVADPAIDLNNNSANSIFYAAKGMVSIRNNATLKEVTGFKIHLDNNASVEYESGLADVQFSSGPGGSWVLKAGTTREIR